MTNQVGRMLIDKVKNFRSAIKYLDSCGEITLEKLQKANEIAGADMPESQLRTMWETTDFVLPGKGTPSGKEFLRYQMKQTLEEGIQTFEDLVRKMGA